MENNLQHHGIKGQRWGVRRYQNEDGSLTEAGKKNLKKAMRESKETGKKVAVDNKTGKFFTYGQSVKDERKEASKNRRNLSDADLKKRIERMKLEKEMKDLTDADLSPGKKFINEVLSTSGKRVATTVATGATLYAIKAGLEGKIDLKEAAGYLAPRPKNK